MAPPESKTSAVEGVSAEPASSASGTLAQEEAKTKSDAPIPSAPPISSQKPLSTAAKSSITSSNNTSTSATQALSSSAESLQLLSQQQEDYCARLQELQKQRSTSAAPSISVPSTVTSLSTAATPSKTATQVGTSTVTMDAALRAQEEARKHQMQRYQAMSSGDAAPKTPEEFSKLRQEKLVRMQQNVTVLAAQAAQKRTNDEWLRNKLLLEQEQLRLLQLHEQQLKQVDKGQAAAIADSLLVQQQQVMRQQQLLHEMLKKQQLEQHAELQRQLALQSAGKVATPAAATTLIHKPKTQLETQMEALAQVALQLKSAANDVEMRQALDKMTSWLHRCTQLPLLQIAQLDFRDVMAQRQPALVRANQWTMDLKVKFEYITQKILQLVGVFMLREKTKAATAQAAAMTTIKTTTSAPATAAQKAATATAAEVKKEAGANDRSAASSIERDYAALKVQMQTKLNELQQKQGGSSAGATTTAALAATYKRPLQVQIPASSKKPRVGNSTTSLPAAPTISTVVKPRPATPPISPRVAQQFYDFDMSPRNCTEAEDKMYLPTKAIAKIMHEALPGGANVGASTPMKSSKVVADNQEPIQISEDAVTFMQECVTEFLLYFTSEARDQSILENRRTKKGLGLSISGANVIDGMENLGLSSYARVLAVCNEKTKLMQDTIAQRKWERKKQIRQRALQEAAAAAAARAKAVGTLPNATAMYPRPNGGTVQPAAVSLVGRSDVSPSAVKLQQPIGVKTFALTGASMATKAAVPIAKPVTATATARPVQATAMARPVAGATSAVARTTTAVAPPAAQPATTKALAAPTVAKTTPATK